MVPLGVIKQLSICLHSKMLSHPSITTGFRDSQHCFKHDKKLTLHHFPALFICLCSVAKQNNHHVQSLSAKVKECCLENGLHLHPSVILSHFEGGIICSITLQFPGARHQGCFYHFSQATWKAVQNHGLQAEYTSNNELRFFISQLMALAFLPKWEISIHYAELKQQNPAHSLSWIVF